MGDSDDEQPCNFHEMELDDRLLKVSIFNNVRLHLKPPFFNNKVVKTSTKIFAFGSYDYKRMVCLSNLIFNILVVLKMCLSCIG